MKYDIDDRVVLKFSAERLQEKLFEAVDGLTAVVTERYKQALMPDVDFYEVELEKPIEYNGERLVVISGLIESDLEPFDSRELSEKKKINPKYLTKDAKAMKSEIKKHAHKDSDDASAYTSHPNGGWKADYDKKGELYKTKVSGHTKKFKEMFGESAEHILESNSDKALKDKAEKSGIPKGILKQVYNRGLAAWRTGHRPGVTQHQWAMARVNSFATKGKGTWGKADKDLAAKVRELNEASGYAYTPYRMDPKYVFESKIPRRYFDIYFPDVMHPELKRQLGIDDDYERAVELGVQKPYVIEDSWVEEMWVKHYLEPSMGSSGLDGFYFDLIAVRFKIKFEVYPADSDDSIDTDEIEIEIGDIFGKERAKFSVEKEFPFEISNLEVHFEDGWNLDKVTFKGELGER